MGWVCVYANTEQNDPDLLHRIIRPEQILIRPFKPVSDVHHWTDVPPGEVCIVPLFIAGSTYGHDDDESCRTSHKTSVSPIL